MQTYKVSISFDFPDSKSRGGGGWSLFFYARTGGCNVSRWDFARSVLIVHAHVYINVQHIFKIVTPLNTKVRQAQLACRYSTTQFGPSFLPFLAEVTH